MGPDQAQALDELRPDRESTLLHLNGVCQTLTVTAYKSDDNRTSSLCWTDMTSN